MQADDFFNAYMVLNENRNSVMDRLKTEPEKPLDVSNEPSPRFTGGVDIVCLAFSVELNIKNLHVTLSNEQPKGHNILKLFKKLPEQIQKEIFEHNSISRNPFFTRGDIFSPKSYNNDFSPFDGFLEHIKSIADGFIKWRYSYESMCLKYNSSFAITFIDAIRTVSNRVKANKVQ